MKKNIIFLVLLILTPFITLIVRDNIQNVSGAPPYHVDNGKTNVNIGKFGFLKDWKRPEGPPRVGLQVGHWKLGDIPKELHKLEGNTGAEGRGKLEWEVNYEIAMLTKDILEKNGVVVDLIPATVPKSYWADVFVSIHADGSTDPLKSGYKVAAPWRDYTGNASKLVTSIENAYEASTRLPKDPEITTNMRGYYAFSFWRFDHAIHPMTTASILETGFLTNLSDSELLINDPLTPAEGLAVGIIEYLIDERLLDV